MMDCRSSSTPPASGGCATATPARPSMMLRRETEEAARSIVRLPSRAVTAVDGATQVQLYMGGDENRIWEIHDALAGRIPHAAVHFREELPERWHYRASPRVGEIVVTADLGWMVAPARGDRAWRGGGMHGWDPAHRSMHGIFLAAGPGVDRAGVIPSFENIHVHPFVAALLGIEPAPGIDGRAEVLAPYVLRETAVR